MALSDARACADHVASSWPSGIRVAVSFAAAVVLTARRSQVVVVAGHAGQDFHAVLGDRDGLMELLDEEREDW